MTHYVINEDECCGCENVAVVYSHKVISPVDPKILMYNVVCADCRVLKYMVECNAYERTIKEHPEIIIADREEI